MIVSKNEKIRDIVQRAEKYCTDVLDSILSVYVKDRLIGMDLEISDFVNEVEMSNLKVLSLSCETTTDSVHAIKMEIYHQKYQAVQKGKRWRKKLDMQVKKYVYVDNRMTDMDLKMMIYLRFSFIVKKIWVDEVLVGHRQRIVECHLRKNSTIEMEGVKRVSYEIQISKS